MTNEGGLSSEILAPPCSSCPGMCVCVCMILLRAVKLGIYSRLTLRQNRKQGQKMAPCWVVLRPSCQIGPATELGPSEGRGSFQPCYWAARSSSRCTNHTVHAATRMNRHMIYRSKLLSTCMQLLLVDNPDLHLDRCSDSTMAVPVPIRFRSGGLRTLRGPLWGTAALAARDHSVGDTNGFTMNDR